MAKVIIKMQLMPESPETDMEAMQNHVKEVLTKYEAKGETIEVVPVAFGLNSLNINFMVDEENGSTEPIEADMLEIEGVRSAEVTGVSRALG